MDLVTVWCSGAGRTHNSGNSGFCPEIVSPLLWDYACTTVIIPPFRRLIADLRSLLAPCRRRMRDRSFQCRSCHPPRTSDTGATVPSCVFARKNVLWLCTNKNQNIHPPQMSDTGVTDACPHACLPEKMCCGFAQLKTKIFKFTLPNSNVVYPCRHCILDAIAPFSIYIHIYLKYKWALQL